MISLNKIAPDTYRSRRPLSSACRRALHRIPHHSHTRTGGLSSLAHRSLSLSLSLSFAHRHTHSLISRTHTHTHTYTLADLNRWGRLVAHDPTLAPSLTTACHPHPPRRSAGELLLGHSGRSKPLRPTTSGCPTWPQRLEGGRSSACCHERRGPRPTRLPPAFSHASLAIAS